MKRLRLPLIASVCLVLVLMSSCLLGSADAKKKKYVGETGGDFEFIDEVSSKLLPTVYPTWLSSCPTVT